MPRFAIVLPVEAAFLGQRYLRQRGDAVVHLLAADEPVAVAEPLEHRVGKVVVDDLGLLQAQDVGGVIAQEPLDDVEAEAHRIDVPRGDRERHQPVM